MGFWVVRWWFGGIGVVDLRVWVWGTSTIVKGVAEEFWRLFWVR